MASAKLDEKAQMRKDFEQLQREYKNMEAMRKVRGWAGRPDTAARAAVARVGGSHVGACMCVRWQAYSEESLGIIKRQRDMIDKLQRDNEVRGVVRPTDRARPTVHVRLCT